MTVIAVVVGCFVFYGLMAAFVGVHLYEQWDRRDAGDAYSAAAWGAVFWPVGLWVMLAVAWLERRERQRQVAEVDRLERERLYELARPDLERLGLDIPQPGVPTIDLLDDERRPRRRK